MVVARSVLMASVMTCLVTACSPATKTNTATYYCGAQQITVEFAPKEIALTLNDQNINLALEPTSQGVRYINPDYNAQFWTRGDEGQLVIDDKVYPLCIAKGTLPQQLSARGNEPFWLLQRKGEAAALRQPAGDRDFTSVDIAYSNEAAPYWTLQLDSESQLKVYPQTCTDSMSGMPYPYSAELIHNGATLRGCAGEPRQLFAGATWVQRGAKATQPPSVQFMNDGTVTGFSGCNRFFGEYRITGEGLDIGRMSTTKIMCNPTDMANENNFLRILESTESFSVENVSVEKQQLKLATANEHLIFSQR